MDDPVTAAQTLDQVTILFCGDSGDGMQLTGSQLTTTSAVHGNDVRTLPDYPSEIRAPAGSLAGVSAFQLQFANHEIHTPGDRPDVLVAMNPASLKVYLGKLQPQGTLIIDQDAFTERGLVKAGYTENPLDDPGLASRYRVHVVPATTLTLTALEGLNADGLSQLIEEEALKIYREKEAEIGEKDFRYLERMLSLIHI